MKTWVMVTATAKKTRVVVTTGEAVVLRATLPPLAKVAHERAVTTLLEALSLWTDERLCVALCADDAAGCFRFDLIDEMGRGANRVYYAIEVVKREPRRRTPKLVDGGRAEQPASAAPAGGAR